MYIAEDERNDEQIELVNGKIFLDIRCLRKGDKPASYNDAESFIRFINKYVSVYYSVRVQKKHLEENTGLSFLDMVTIPYMGYAILVF